MMTYFKDNRVNEIFNLITTGQFFGFNAYLLEKLKDIAYDIATNKRPPDHIINLICDYLITAYYSEKSALNKVILKKIFLMLKV